MSYLQDDESDQSPLSHIAIRVGGLLAFIGAFLAVQFLPSGIFPWQQREWTPERIGNEVERDPGVGELFRTIKANYPEEYRGFLNRVAADVRTGDHSAIQRQSFDFTRRLTQDHFDDLARAPSAQILEIARQYAALIHALRRTDVGLCADFVTVGFRPGLRPAAEVLAILNRIAVLQIEASRLGETQPRDPRGQLSDRDARQFFGAVQARSQSTANLLLDQRALSAAPARRQCDAGIDLYEVIAALPDEQAANVTIDILRQSFSSPNPTT